jgi:uncharacterized membrane protein YdjX (TVP38/TMEM64 family)
MNLKKTLSGTFLILSSGPLQFVGAVIAVILAGYVPEGETTWWIWCALFIVSTLLMSLGLISSSVTFGIAAFFWSWKAFPLLFVAYMLSSYFGYKIGSTLGEDLVEGLKKKYKKVQDIINELSTASLFDIFMIRISPILPFSMVNYLMGATKVKMRDFMLAGTAGMAPRAALAFFLGTSARSIEQIIAGEAMDMNQKTGLIITAVLTIGYLVYRFGLKPNKKAPVK